MYYNPFSNAIEYSDQPGARFRSTPNPDYGPALANTEALRQWLNEEVDLVSTTDLLVADATLSGNLVRNVADFAIGYQYRRMQADGDPNDPGDATLNPCAVVGDRGCAPGDQFGPYLFTGVHRPYAADQQVQRLFGEAGPGHRTPPRHADSGELRILQRGRPPRRQLRPEGRLAPAGGREPALLTGVPRLRADQLSHAVPRRPEPQPADDRGVGDGNRPLERGRPLRATGDAAARAGVHLQRRRRALPGGRRRGHGRLLALRLPERDRLDAPRYHREPVRQRRPGAPPSRRSSFVPKAGPRIWRPPTGVRSGTWSGSRSTW